MRDAAFVVAVLGAVPMGAGQLRHLQPWVSSSRGERSQSFDGCMGWRGYRTLV